MKLSYLIFILIITLNLTQQNPTQRAHLNIQSSQKSSQKSKNDILKKLNKHHHHKHDSELNKIDNNSFSNTDKIETEHVHLELKVDFEKEKLTGFSILDLQTKKRHVKEIVLDMYKQNITNVELLSINNIEEKEKELEFQVENQKNKYKFLGEKLVIFIPENISNYIRKHDSLKIKIEYETGKEQTAISYLKKEQTMSKSHSFLFTQCEAIGCRSLSPLQDTPQIKNSYSANITIPEEYQAFMSGKKIREVGIDGTYDKIVMFQQDIKVPSYLIALVVGNLEERKIDKRSYVITEPTEMDKSFEILENLENYVEVLEKYIGEYKWGEYKIVVMPNAFPFAGMENPMLTFVTPQIITPDKAGLYVAIHEIAHSWFGNTVTCENWENLWLNEGLTTFLEHKGVKYVFGEDIYEVSAFVSQQQLNRTVKFLTDSNDDELTSLNPKSGLYHPDEYINSIPYEKGYSFALYLESIVGEEKFRDFLRSYIQKFEYKSISWKQFKQRFEEFFEDTYIHGIESIDWNLWIKGKGNASNLTNFENSLVDAAKNLAKSYIVDHNYESKAQYQDFHILQQLLFVGEVRQYALKGFVDGEVIDRLEEDFEFFDNEHTNIIGSWLGLKITFKDDLDNKDLRQISDYLAYQGMASPASRIYRALLENGYCEFAADNFEENMSFYHFQTVYEIQHIFEDNQCDISGILFNDGENESSNNGVFIQKRMIRMKEKYNIIREIY